MPNFNNSVTIFLTLQAYLPPLRRAVLLWDTDHDCIIIDNDELKEHDFNAACLQLKADLLNVII